MHNATDVSSSRLGRNLLRWVGRIAGAIVGLLLLAAAIAATREFLAAREDLKRFPREGQRVDVGGYSLNLNCTGNGSPTVILESGWSVPGVSWSLVQPEVSRFARVCSYDRAGYGWSDEGPMPRTADEVARELHTLLHNAGVNPPYVLAGHSLGGYIIRSFQGMYPSEVVGMVLVDPSQEDMNDLMPVELKRAYQEQINELKRFAPFLPVLAGLGILRTMVHTQQEDYKLTPDLLEEVTYLSAQPKTLRAMASEIGALIDNDQDPKEMRNYGTAPGTLGELPLIVLTAGSPPQDSSIQGLTEFLKVTVPDLHLRLSRLSSRGKQITVDASHFIPFEKPQAVVMAVREVHDAAIHTQKP